MYIKKFTKTGDIKRYFVSIFTGILSDVSVKVMFVTNVILGNPQKMTIMRCRTSLPLTTVDIHYNCPRVSKSNNYHGRSRTNQEFTAVKICENT